MSRASTKEIIALYERLLKIEPPLFQRRIGDFAYYHFIRFHIFEQILVEKGWIHRADLRGSVTKKTLISLARGLLKNACSRGLWLDRIPSDVLVFNSGAKTGSGSDAIDPYVDVLLEEAPFSYAVLEDVKRWRHAEGRCHASHPFLDGMHLRMLLGQKLLSKHGRAIRDEAQFLARHLRSLDIDVPEARLVFLMKRALNLYRFFMPPFRRYLKRKGVKAVLLVTHYDPVKMVMTQAAKSLHLPVVELQHGAMGRYNIAYNFVDFYPNDTLPDEVWTFGPYWNRTARMGSRVRFLAMGSPYVERRVEKTATPKQSGRRRVLIISQWTVAKTFEQTALALHRTLDADRYEIVYKLHPGEYGVWRKSYSREFQTAGIQVLENADIYSLFAASDIIVGVYSTALIESLFYGCALILLEEYGVHFFLDLIESGRATLAKTGEEAVAAVKALPSFENDARTLDEYWSRNAGQKMQHRIRTLLENASHET